MVDYIEQIKNIEVRFEKHDKGFRPVIIITDWKGAVLKESEYDSDEYEDNTEAAYRAVIEKLQSIL
jgi:hypothetical protein